MLVCWFAGVLVCWWQVISCFTEILIKGPEDYPFYFGASIELLSRAGNLRRDMTRAEKILWQKLRNKQMDGFRFRRQHPIDTFVADFFCYQAMQVVEVDGGMLMPGRSYSSTIM